MIFVLEVIVLRMTAKMMRTKKPEQVKHLDHGAGYLTLNFRKRLTGI